jgi:anti-sigma B factor antagonist
MMNIDFVDINDTVRRIILRGRLDLEGTEAISPTFKSLTDESRKKVIVDLSSVSFLASMGIRELITNAKLVQKHGGQMVLMVGQNVLITKILETTNIDKLLPMYKDAIEAEKAILA